MIQLLKSSNRAGNLRRMAACLLILALSTTGFTSGNGSGFSARTSATAPRSLGPMYSAFDAHTFVSAESGDPSTLDPALAYDITSGQVIQNVYDTLIFYDGDKADAFVPQLASSYELSGDGLTWTFHIRTGVTFQNGDSLTPADVAYSFQRGLLQGGSGSPQWLLTEPFLGVGIDDITQLIAPDGSLEDNRSDLQSQDPAKLVAACEQVKAAIVADNTAGTVSMHLAQPWGPFLATIAGTWGSILDKNWTIAQGAWDGSCSTWQNWYATNSGEDPLTAVTNGTGPFSLDHWTPGVEVVLARNDSYWRTPAQLEHIELLNIPDENTRIAMLQNGNADQATLSDAGRTIADGMVGEDCQWNVNAAQYDCSVVDATKPLHRYRGQPGISQDEGLFNFKINVPAGGNPYIGSGQLDGNGVPLDFFSDIHVRKAFNYCFNWDTYNQDVYGGTAVQPTTLVLQGMPGYDLTAAHYTFNAAQAEAEFKASTLIGTGGLSLWDTGFHIQMIYNEGNTARLMVAEILASNIHTLNPKFVVDVVGLSTPDFRSARSSGEIPFIIGGWQEDVHDPHNWYQPYLIGAYAGLSHIPNDLIAQFKPLIDQGVSLTDFAARDTIYKQLNQLVYDNAPLILLGGATTHGYVRRRVHGLVLNPIFDGRYYYTIYKDPVYFIYLPLVMR